MPKGDDKDHSEGQILDLVFSFEWLNQSSGVLSVEKNSRGEVMFLSSNKVLKYLPRSTRVASDSWGDLEWPF